MEFILVWLFVGFLAQFIDGTIGMGYGVSSTAALVTIGVYPAIASASVHTAKIFTGLASGGAHLKFGNVERNWILHLVIPGIFGGVSGAFVLTQVSGKAPSVIVGAVLLIMGFIILFKFASKNNGHFRTTPPSSRMLVPLGYVAAFTDALGGGGWGPIATTTLVCNNCKPCKAIGSVNFAEIFVAAAEAVTFLLLLGPANFNWLVVLGLIAGGVICAPIAAWLCKKMPHRILGLFVAASVIALSIYIIIRI